MEVKVELCPPEEWEPMVKIFTEMEEHYYGKGIIQEPLMKNYLRKYLFNQLSGTLVIRAYCDNRISGLACCSILFPSPRYSSQLHIKELYVSQSDRSKGIGKHMMHFIAGLALEQECLSLSWNAEKSNPSANRFYQSLGARINDNIVSYYLHGESLSKLALCNSAEPGHSGS
ncbi:GNAT family N-acetyltransferase [Pectobacterium punjabense]|uniref:GNAT family N-acetyltransferase n=1 Tax=Pectobacterium punjabense TaxID=2108399 RepID=UPI00240495BC|nr:GNAT family N-acetyltransferase [Pectobacterium punjabense]MDG0798795.1 GNAT family N-acetyltransferase [Pectobacterium punjabense]